jgi:probable HAF family extracellular repeat protein
MTNRSRMYRRALAALAAAVLAALVAMPASADTPPAGDSSILHGFLAEDGVVRAIDHPNATTFSDEPGGQAGTVTSGINDHGDILGSYEDRRDRVVHHFVLDKRGRYTEIENPPDGPDGAAYDEPIDINNRGEIVGWYNDQDGLETSGFLRTRKGRYVDIRVPGSERTAPFKINDRREVVGLYEDEAGKIRGFLWDGRDYETIDVAGATLTWPTGINNRGQVVGFYVDAADVAHGFVRDRGGRVTALPDAPGGDPRRGGTVPASINDHGQIVGGVNDARGSSRAFLYERGRYTLFDGAGDATYTRALDLNDKGEIVGDYGTPQAPTPAASTASSTRRAATG